MRIPAMLLTFLVVLLLAAATAGGAGRASGDAEPPATSNPCLGPNRSELRCPDLQMRRPYDLYVQHTPRGRSLLRASSAIKSRGRGPIELHGTRTGKKEMRTTQIIYRANGSHLDVRSAGELYFYLIPGQGRYWKFSDAARFQLWSLDRKGRRKRLVRTGPKVRYCLRDLIRTSTSSRSPAKRVYPGCSQNSSKRRVTLGTSAGWSDVYPATYHEQWIDVTGLRGCFAYVMVADPKDHIFESHEDNNEAQRVVRLPFERGPGRCP